MLRRGGRRGNAAGASGDFRQVALMTATPDHDFVPGKVPGSTRQRVVSGERPRQTSPSFNQPSPVPRLYTVSVSSTVPAGIESCCASFA